MTHCTSVKSRRRRPTGRYGLLTQLERATPQGPTGKHRRFEVVTNWVTTFTAVAAFVLSMLTYIQSKECRMSMS